MYTKIFLNCTNVQENNEISDLTWVTVEILGPGGTPPAPLSSRGLDLPHRDRLLGLRGSEAVLSSLSRPQTAVTRHLRGECHSSGPRLLEHRRVTWAAQSRVWDEIKMRRHDKGRGVSIRGKEDWEWSAKFLFLAKHFQVILNCNKLIKLVKSCQW